MRCIHKNYEVRVRITCTIMDEEDLLQRLDDVIGQLPLDDDNVTIILDGYENSECHDCVCNK